MIEHKYNFKTNSDLEEIEIEIDPKIQKLCAKIFKETTGDQDLNANAMIVHNYLSNKKTLVSRSNTKENNEIFQRSHAATMPNEQKKATAPENSVFSKSFSENLAKINIIGCPEKINDDTLKELIVSNINNLVGNVQCLINGKDYEEKKNKIQTLLSEFQKEPTKENFMKILAAADARRTIWGIFKPHQNTYNLLKKTLTGNTGNKDAMQQLFDAYEGKNTNNSSFAPNKL